MRGCPRRRHGQDQVAPPVKRCPGRRTMIPVQELGELVLEVRDLEQAKAFYGELLGLPVKQWDPRVAVIEGAAFRLQLRLYGTPGHRGAGPCHFAFRVAPEEIDGIAAALEARGLL